MALPEPGPGLVIRYAYLWRSEAERGRDDGSKDRPCAVILAVKRSMGRTTVVVAPITHARPYVPELAVELPSETKKRLGLDDAPSWIVADDLNHFDWPGPDLRPIPGRSGADRFIYGHLSNRTTRQIIEKVRELVRKGNAKVSDRSE